MQFNIVSADVLRKAQEKPEDYPPADRPVDSFSFHCGMAAMLFPIINIRSSSYDHQPEVNMGKVWRKIADSLLYGDYYPLTPFTHKPDQWVAWQFHRPERGEGFIQAIRLTECPQETFQASPECISTENEYDFENLETGEKIKLSGPKLLSEGFKITLPVRSGSIWRYRVILKRLRKR